MSSRRDVPGDDPDDTEPGSVTSQTERTTGPLTKAQRVLLGFLTEEDAPQRLQQHENLQNPLGTSDAANHGADDDSDAGIEIKISPDRTGDDGVNQEKRDAMLEATPDEFHETYREAAEAITTLDHVTVRADQIPVEPLPDDPEITEHIDEYTSQDKIEDWLADIADDTWTFGRVPISSLVAIQPFVTVEDYRSVPS